MRSMGVLRMRLCWREGDVELLVAVLLLVVDEVVEQEDVLQDAVEEEVGVEVVLDVLLNEKDVVVMLDVVEEVRTAWSLATPCR